MIISQHQFSLSSWACQLFSSISLSSHAQFSWFNFFWLEFSHSFSVISLFDWFHFHIWDFDQIYYCKQLFYFVSCFSWEVFHLSFFFIVFCFLVWDFSQAFCYKLLFNLMQHFQKRSLFVLLNFRSTNFSSICIQYMRVNLANLIDKDLISLANQIQLKVSNQL